VSFNLTQITLVGNPESKRLIGRLGGKCKSNILMSLTEIAWEDIGWIHLIQDRGY
jgi:hypothetical protein